MRAQSRVAITIAAGLACLLVFVGTASASYEDPPIKLGAESGNLESSAEYLLESSPRKIPGIEPTAESEALYKTVAEPPPEADALIEEELESETPSLLRQVGAWAWNKVPEAAVAVGGGWVGWEIGSLIYGTFFEEASPGGASLTYLADKWQMTTPGQLLLSEGAGDIHAPAWGLRGYSSKVLPFGRTTENGICEDELYGDGARLYSPGWEPIAYCGSKQYHDYVLWKPFEVMQCGKGGVTCPGIEPIPYEGGGQPTAPAPEALRESLKEALESGAYPVLNRLYNFEQEPENFPDLRIIEEKNDHRCDRTPGASYENPGGNVSPEPFAKKIEAPFTVTNRPEGFGETEVFLHWGTTFWRPGDKEFEGTPYVDEWGGWGYRHILAKHGWSALDREETELALTTGVPIPTPKEGKVVYSAPEIDKGVGGVECIRHVVVDFETGEGDPAPRGIVTSYNEVVK